MPQDKSIRRELSVARRRLRTGARVLGVALLLLIAAGAVVIARFDPNDHKASIVAEVKEATGRDLALNGPIALKWAFLPVIEARDVTLSNPLGFSRPQMAHLERLELRLALLPLISRTIDIKSLVLINPDIRLETDAQGTPNWTFAAEHKVAPQNGVPSQPCEGSPTESCRADESKGADGQPVHATAGSSVGTATRPAARPTTEPDAFVHFNRIAIQGGQLAFLNGRTGTTTTLAITRLAVTADSAEAPVRLTADLVLEGLALSLKADTGSLDRVQDPAALDPWPVRLTIESGVNRLAAEGSLTRPLVGKGYRLAVSADIGDLSTLAPIIPALTVSASTLPPSTLPPLRDIALRATVQDSGSPFPTISDVTLRVGASDLRQRQPGLWLDRLEVAAPAPSQPVKLDATIRVGNAPVTIAATLGHPDLLRPGSPARPYPVDIVLTTGAARLTAKGSVGKPDTLEDAAIDLAFDAPDLAPLSQLSSKALPSIKDIAFRGTLTDAPGGLRRGGTLHGMRLTTRSGDLTGDLAVAFGHQGQDRSSVTASLNSQRLDLDALLAAFRDAETAAADHAVSAEPGNGTPGAAASPPNGGAVSVAPPPARTRSDRVIPDTPIPFDRLTRHNADIRLRVAAVRVNEAEYKSLDAHLVLRDGRASLDRFTASAPEGAVAITAAVDTTQSPQRITLSVRAPNIAIRPLLVALGERPFADGRLEAMADLQGAGATARAIAASLDGTAGFAMAGGSYDPGQVGGFLAKVASQTNVLELIGRGGAKTSDIRCLAVRFDVRQGVATLNPLLLSSSLLTASGSGSVNLRDETVALMLRPQGRIGGTGFSVPLRVSGTLRQPKADIDASAAAGANAGTIAGIIIGGTTPLGMGSGLLGADRPVGGNQSTSCPVSLALVRGQAVPTEAAEAPVAPARRNEPINPGALLRQFIR